MTGNLSLLGSAAQGPVQDWALPFLSFNQLCHATLDALLVSHIYYQILIKKAPWRMTCSWCASLVLDSPPHLALQLCKAGD